MATVNYSVPDEIKDAFNTVFAGCNKSRIISDLMREAVERELRQRAHVCAADAILRRRGDRRRVLEKLVTASRERLRK